MTCTILLSRSMPLNGKQAGPPPTTTALNVEAARDPAEWSATPVQAPGTLGDRIEGALEYDGNGRARGLRRTLLLDAARLGWVAHLDNEILDWPIGAGIA